MALILGNPSCIDEIDEYTNTEALPKIKSTLVVVPSTLVEQWWRELHTRIDKDKTEKPFSVLNFSGHSSSYKNYSVPMRKCRPLTEGDNNWKIGQRVEFDGVSWAESDSVIFKFLFLVTVY
jgi:SNF2 family DNA or RNA helicase